MAIKKRIDEVVIEVGVPSPWFSNRDDPRKEWIREAKEVMQNIKHHIDGITDINLRIDETEYCEFCGNPHNEPDACCQKSIDEIEKVRR